MKSAFQVSYKFSYEIMPNTEGSQAAKKRVQKEQRENWYTATNR